MTPHDCATQGHRLEPVVTTWCETCGHGDESVSLDVLLRRALTDETVDTAIAAAFAENTEGAARDVLITAILTAARETGR